MKKITITAIISFMILGLASIGMAADVAGSGGLIDLDGAGNMSPVALSAKGLALYTSDSGAGGLPADTAGNQYCVVTGSTGGTAGIHLDFLMRGSQTNTDNNLYQLLTGTLPTVPTDLSATSTDPTAGSWVIRGGS